MSKTDTQSQLDTAMNKLQNLEQAIELANNPSIQKSASIRHTAGDGLNTVSYWGGAEQKSYTVQEGMSLNSRMKSYLQSDYDSNYIPADHNDGSKFKSLGDFLRTGYRAGGYRSADFCGRHMQSFSKLKAVEGMSIQDGESASFLIYPEFSNQILEHVYANQLFASTDNYTVAGNQLIFSRNAEASRANGSRHGGLQGGWVGEGETISDSKPKIRRVALRLNKLAVVVYLTQELIEDGGPSIEQYVTRKVGEEFNFMIGDSIWSGTSNGQPLGINNSGALLTVTKETSQPADTIVPENLDKMHARRIGPLVSSEGGGYAWYHNQDVAPALDSLTQDVTNNGVVLYRPDGMIEKEAPKFLKGSLRIVTEFQETLGNAGDIVLADLGQYVTISKGGISQAASIHVQFLTDQTALKFTMRLDGRPWEDTPITPYKGSNTQACFVNLEAR